MTQEQEKQIEVLIESLDLDEYDVVEIFDKYDFDEFIFPEDVEAVTLEIAQKVIKDMEDRCLE